MQAPPTPLPDGWTQSWSPEHNAWFYFHAPTNTSQWQPPASPAYPFPPPGPPTPAYSPIQQQPAQPQPQKQGGIGGLFNSFNKMDPKMQTAIGVGGGMLAGAFIEHEAEEIMGKTHHNNSGFFGGGGHSHHHNQHHHGGGLGNVAGLLGAAGVGALGASLLQGKGRGGGNQPPPVLAPQQQQQPQYFPPQPGFVSPPPAYSTPAPPPGQGRPNMLANAAIGGAVGAAGAAAFSGVSNMMHHHPAGGGGGPRPATMSPRPGGRLSQGGAPPSFGNSFGSLGSGYNGPPLYIQAAVFGDRDVTQAVRSMVDEQQQFVSKGSELVTKLGDPWPEVEVKALVVLYQYGDRPMEVLVGDTGNDVVQIKHEALAKGRMNLVNTNTQSRIISLVWGSESMLTEARVQQLEKDGEIEANQSNLGNGGWHSWLPRVLTCFYRTDTGHVGIATARQDGTVRLPWNPLAKWG